MRTTAIAIASLAALAGAPTLAHASYVQIASNVGSSTSQLGRFTGSLNYTSNTANTGTLTIVLNNTNSTRDGGFITGVLFNIPGADTHATAALMSSSLSGFRLTKANASAAPFGTFEAGAALGGYWLGGGSPVGGIAAGTTGTLTFRISATDAGSLSASDFLSSMCGPSMVVRFKGFNCGGSDKVPVTPVTTIPAPSVAGLGLLGLGAMARSRRRG